jgi:cold shock CspA family protein
MVDMDDGRSIGVAHSDFEVIPSATGRSAASKKEQRSRKALQQRQKRKQNEISEAEERGAASQLKEMKQQLFGAIKDLQQHKRMFRRKMRHDAQQLRRKITAEAKEEGRNLKIKVQARDRAKRIKVRHLISDGNKPLRKDEQIRVRAAQALREDNQKMIESAVGKARREAVASVGRNIQRRGMRKANRPGGLETTGSASLLRETGQIKVWKSDKGYGFIHGNIDDIFFHIKNVIGGAEYLHEDADVGCLDAEYVQSYDKKRAKWHAQRIKVTRRSELAASRPIQTR